MALITCPECGHQISNRAVSCPNCGCPASDFPPAITYTYDYNGNTKDVSVIVRHLQEGDSGAAFGDAWDVFGDHTKPSQINLILDGIIAKYNIVVPEPVKPVPKCPTCGSEKIHKLSAATRGVSLGLFGLASKTARSQFVCENCGYKW